jgi:hypothetical protein
MPTLTPVLEPEPMLEPDPDVEVDDVPVFEVTAFVTTTPAGVTACQTWPTPCPFTSPAFLSAEKRYSGMPR